MTLKVYNLEVGVNETKHLAHHESCEWNVDWTKVYVIYYKNRIMMNFGVVVKNPMVGAFV